MQSLQYNSILSLKLLNAIVPVSRFNKGEVGKIIEEVKQDGIRIIVKNNVPECVLIPVEEYERLIEKANNKAGLIQSKEEDEKRKAFIQKIRANVQPPLPPRMTVKERKAFLESMGPIEVDEEAINELRRISTL